MPLQSGQVSKLRLYREAHEARYENSRDIRMYLKERELWILSTISHHESETGLQLVYTVYPFYLDLGVLKASLETFFQTFAIIGLFF